MADKIRELRTELAKIIKGKRKPMYLGQRFSVFMEIMRCGRKMQDVMNS